MPDTLTAQFDLGNEAANDGDYVLRSGKLFEAGDYPDKDFSLTPEEIEAAAVDFSPVPVDLEHTETVLAGRLGEVRQLRAEGGILHGTVALPGWLDKLLRDGERKVSCTWDRVTKRLTGLALVRNPRIPDAALMSAFAEFAGRRHSADDQAALQQIHDLTVGQGAACKAEYGRQHMSAWDRLKAFLKKSGEDESIADDLQAEFGKKIEAVEDPRVKVLEERLAATEKAARQSQFASDAREALASLAGRIYPAEAPALAALFAQLAEDDHAVKADVTFAEGKTGTRVEALKALLAQRPEHGLRREQVPGVHFGVFPAEGETKPKDGKPTPERRAALLNHTPVGATILSGGGK